MCVDLGGTFPTCSARASKKSLSRHAGLRNGPVRSDNVGVQPAGKENTGFHQVGPKQKWFFAVERGRFEAAAEFERN